VGVEVDYEAADGDVQEFAGDFMFVDLLGDVRYRIRLGEKCTNSER